MLSRLLWRRRGFILDQLFDLVVMIGTQPMAYLAPLGIVAGRCIRVCESEYKFNAAR